MANTICDRWHLNLEISLETTSEANLAAYLEAKIEMSFKQNLETVRMRNEDLVKEFRSVSKGRTLSGTLGTFELLANAPHC